MNSKLWNQAYDRLCSIYGKNPPELCLCRLEEEKQELESTDAIELFTAMGRIREEARQRNTAVIITGTINSCFAAWLVGGTVVNPLPPHYVTTHDISPRASSRWQPHRGTEPQGP